MTHTYKDKHIIDSDYRLPSVMGKKSSDWKGAPGRLTKCW